MKKVLRHEDNRQYWDRRWSEGGSDPNHFSDLNIYPICYAEMVIGEQDEKVLEIGAGLGRVLKHYHYAGFDISAIERSEVAVNQLLQEDSELKIQAADVCDLPFDHDMFDVVMAFGVYHNLEQGLESALIETARCLKPGGRFCISMRPNNIEMHLNEMYWNWKQRIDRNGNPSFHKWLVGENEFTKLLENYGLVTTQIHRARNVSILYRIPWLRSRTNNETDRRGKGYKMNLIGRILDACLVNTLPSQFCNVLVYTGTKMATNEICQAA